MDFGILVLDLDLLWFCYVTMFMNVSLILILTLLWCVFCVWILSFGLCCIDFRFECARPLKMNQSFLSGDESSLRHSIMFFRIIGFVSLNYVQTFWVCFSDWFSLKKIKYGIALDSIIQNHYHSRLGLISLTSILNTFTFLHYIKSNTCLVRLINTLSTSLYKRDF